MKFSLLLDTDLNYMHRQVTQLRNYSGKKRFMERQLRKQKFQKNRLRLVKRRRERRLSKKLKL